MDEDKTYKEGDILHDSWGYDMTINDYCKIIEVSPTGKTVKCKMLKADNTGDDGLGKGRSVPTEQEYGEPFRLHVREWNDGHLFVGSYPFAENSKRKGSFQKWDGKPDYFNTWD